MIEYAFNHTSHGSQLRQVIAEVWVENAGRVRNSDNLIHKLPKEFLQDLCFIFLQKTREKEANKTLDVPKESTKEDVKATEEGDLQEPKNVNLKEEKKPTEKRPNEEKLREKKYGEEIPMEYGKKELKGEEILEEHERLREQKLNEKPSKEKKGKEDKKAKEKDFQLATPISPHVSIDQAEKIPVMEETVPTVPVTEASEQRSDVSVVRNGDGIRDEEIAFISPQELPSDANKQIADLSNGAMSPKTSKKKKQKKNKATLNGTPVSATSPIPQENSLIETGGDDDEVSVNNVVSPAVNGKRYQQGPMADSEQAWLPREWTGAEATHGDYSSPVNDGLASSKASSLQNNSKHKNKNSYSFQNSHSPFPPKGPRADISRQNSSSSSFQGFGNNVRYHNDGHQKKPHGEKGHMGRSNRSRPVYSPGNDPRNERKQKTTSFLDPALQSSLQQIRKSDQKGTDFKKGKARN
ncbi:hypothetical protein BGW36DRAFT_431253 [Talaromyces proteolyticus]|uniref:Uncharacterized protein n=1 Tax=Talaromyces proteolyticus TaxID=1131652 RepID=A0AAD4KLK0_9EURO|nr:uncharacterized protein BGW36DRAFT_431253 [Talaromyces proteolyticus]KAH8692016.1 hypothetical protein BGW36DRAFT_431253 [Talaromyces proteolyticus]